MPELLNNTFWKEYLTQNQHNQGSFSQNQDFFFNFQKRAKEAPPPSPSSSWTLVNVAEYASIIPEYGSVCFHVSQYALTWFNIPEYARIYLNKLLSTPGFSNAFLDIWVDFEYTLNMPGFWICWNIVIIILLLL